MSSGDRWCLVVASGEVVEDGVMCLSGDVALEAADDFVLGATLGAPAASPITASRRARRFTTRWRTLPRHRPTGVLAPAFHRRQFTSIRQLQAEDDTWLIRYHRRRNHSDDTPAEHPPRSSTASSAVTHHDQQPQGPPRSTPTSGRKDRYMVVRFSDWLVPGFRGRVRRVRRRGRVVLRCGPWAGSGRASGGSTSSGRRGAPSSPARGAAGRWSRR